MFINSVFVGNNNLLLTFFCTNCFVADISKSHSDSLTSFLPQFCLSISAALILSESDLQKSFYLPVLLPVLPACLLHVMFSVKQGEKRKINGSQNEWQKSFRKTFPENSADHVIRRETKVQGGSSNIWGYVWWEEKKGSVIGDGEIMIDNHDDEDSDDGMIIPWS